jgi:hypothetical protein
MTRTFTDEALTETLRRHIDLYRWRRPVYQIAMLDALASIWLPQCRGVLDVGGGTGVIAQAVRDHFPVERVASIDLHDRFLGSLTVETQAYDGRTIPFEDGAFDCAMFNNVIHHIPVAARSQVFGEAARAAGLGPIFIKDHLAVSPLDHARLAALDFLGNVPFAGMLEARYLTLAEWTSLAGAIGYRIDSTVSRAYRSGPFEWMFPNRLEITMRWVAA